MSYCFPCLKSRLVILEYKSRFVGHPSFCARPNAPKPNFSADLPKVAAEGNGALGLVMGNWLLDKALPSVMLEPSSTLLLAPAASAVR